MSSEHRLHGRVLVIAGSDSGGGAGVQADIKTIAALGAYASTAITALTAQNSLGVVGVHPVPPEFVAEQIRAVLDDIGTDALKTGMLYDASIIKAVAETLADYHPLPPLVLDPVMVAKGGEALLDPDAGRALLRRLLPLATIVTPNVPEAEHLTGLTITSLNDMAKAADMLLTLGAPAVLLKGGHLREHKVTDILATPGKSERFEHARAETRHTHGTGCTLASGIAAGLAQGMGLHEAVQRARRFVFDAIRTAPGLGQGHGPLNHAVWLK